MLPGLIITPTRQYSTLDPSFVGSGIVLSNGNRTATVTADSTWSVTRSLLSKAKSKWYWEVLISSGGSTNGGYGLCNATQGKDPANFLGSDVNGWCWFGGGSWWYNNVNTAVYASWTAGDTLNFALDMDAGKVWIGKNGTWQNSGNPSAGTGNVTSTGISGSTIFAALAPAFETNVTSIANFGASPFANTVPTGFNAGIFN